MVKGNCRRHSLACCSNDIDRALHCSTIEKKGRKHIVWRKMAFRIGFRVRIELGMNVDERKVEAVQVPMIVELAITPIRRGIQALRFSVHKPSSPSGILGCKHNICRYVTTKSRSGVRRNRELCSRRLGNTEYENALKPYIYFVGALTLLRFCSQHNILPLLSNA